MRSLRRLGALPRAAALASVALLAPACASGPEPSGPPLVAVSDLDNPPFAELDADGRPRGRDVEMAQELARRLGRPLVWERAPFAELLPALEAGRADVAVATLGRTPERARRVAFTRPYYVTTIAALVRVGPGEPERLADLAGRPVAAGAGTTAERAVLAAPVALLLAAEAEPAAKGASALERLLAGEVDAAVMDAPDARELVARHPGLVRVLAEPLAAEEYCVAVRRDDPELLAELDLALEALRASGRLAALDREHGL